MSFAVEALSRPDETQIAAVRRLEADCRPHDGTQGSLPLDPSMNFDPDMPWCFLARAAGRLAGVLAVSAAARDEAEISALVAPEYRRQGCFRILFGEAVRQLGGRGVTELRFPCDRQSDDGFEAAAALGGRICRAVYTMRCRAGDQPPAEVGGLRLRLCGPKDAAAEAELSGRIFGLRPAGGGECVRPGIAPAGRTQYLVLLTGVPVGVAVVTRQGGEAVLCALGLVPEFRGQGLGRRMLALLLGDIFAGDGMDAVTWKVDGGNTAARRLSLSSGFREVAVTDYYRLALPKEG